MKIHSALVRDYNKNKEIEKHFFNSDRDIPIWAIFESISLGEFGLFFDCSNFTVKSSVSKLLNLPTNLDSDGKLTVCIIYCLRDLRNAIAHNNVVFDARFKTSQISNRINTLLENEISIKKIDFDYIGSYIVLVTYLLNKIGVEKEKCKEFITEYQTQLQCIHKTIPNNIYFSIIGTQDKTNITQLKNYL